MTEQNWRDAKMPKWAREEIEAETKRWKITAALAWPTEAKPEPVPFMWGDYDRLFGEAVPGKYWQAAARSYAGLNLTQISIRADDPSSSSIWEFNSGQGWTTNKVRGPLYESEHDARLACLWHECERAADTLAQIRGWIQ